MAPCEQLRRTCTVIYLQNAWHVNPARLNVQTKSFIRWTVSDLFNVNPPNMDGSKEEGSCMVRNMILYCVIIERLHDAYLHVKNLVHGNTS